MEGDVFSIIVNSIQVVKWVGGLLPKKTTIPVVVSKRPAGILGSGFVFIFSNQSSNRFTLACTFTYAALETGGHGMAPVHFDRLGGRAHHVRAVDLSPNGVVEIGWHEMGVGFMPGDYVTIEYDGAASKRIHM